MTRDDVSRNARAPLKTNGPSTCHQIPWHGRGGALTDTTARRRWRSAPGQYACRSCPSRRARRGGGAHWTGRDDIGQAVIANDLGSDARALPKHGFEPRPENGVDSTAAARSAETNAGAGLSDRSRPQERRDAHRDFREHHPSGLPPWLAERYCGGGCPQNRRSPDGTSPPTVAPAHRGTAGAAVS